MQERFSNVIREVAITKPGVDKKLRYSKTTAPETQTTPTFANGSVVGLKVLTKVNFENREY